MRRNILALLFMVIGLASLQQALDSLNPSRQIFLGATGTLLLLLGCASIVLQIYRLQKRRKTARLQKEH